jgi:hypothetical protein
MLVRPTNHSSAYLFASQVFKTLFEVGAWRAACANASSNVKAIVKTFKEVRSVEMDPCHFGVGEMISDGLRLACLARPQDGISVLGVATLTYGH